MSYDTNMVHVHWRLVRNVSRSEGIKEWQRTAVKVSATKYIKIIDNFICGL